MGGRYISHFIDDINVTDIQFLGQRDSGEAVGAAEAAGHHVPDQDIDLPF